MLDLNIEQLEKDWVAYKIKRFRPWIIAGTSIFVVLIATFFWLYRAPEKTVSLNNKNIHPSQRHIAAAAKSSKEIDQSASTRTNSGPAKERPIFKSEEKSSFKVKIIPETNFLTAFEANDNAEKIAKTTPKHHKKSKTKNSAPLFEKTTKKTASSIVIHKNASNNKTLRHLIRRFNTNKDPGLALYIATSFFKKGDYKNAVHWSIVANSLDPSNETTWLLYAKSKANLGKKREAIQALKSYLNQYSSEEIRKYLTALENSL